MLRFHPLDLIPLAARRVFPFPAKGVDVKTSRNVAEATRSLRDFIRFSWHVVEPANAFIPGFHLDAICDHLQAISNGQIRNLLINMPPRHMKSLAVCVFWPAWEWISYPHRRFLFASYALSLSERDSVKCRRLIESPWYRQHFGDAFSLAVDQNTKPRFDNTHGGVRLSTSVGGAATGEGGDRVVVDDPHNVIERESEAKRGEALTWWDQTMSTRLNDPKTGAKIIVMQRVHEKDLSGHVLEQGGYEHLFLPAEFEPARRCTTAIGWIDPRAAEGELLWPARIGLAEIADFKLRLGPEGFAGQFQQRPSPAGGALFRAGWFRYYSGAGSLEHAEATRRKGDEAMNQREALTAPSPLRPGSSSPLLRQTYVLQTPAGTKVVSPENCVRFAVMDPAGTEPGEGRRPCFTVIQVWDVTEAGEMLLVHQYRRQVQAPDAARAAIKLCHDFDVAYIAIEKDGMGLGVVQQVRAAGVAVRSIKARGCKEARSQTAEIRMANGQICFPRGADFLFELEKELLEFPNSEYADQVDALSHAAILVQKAWGYETSEVAEFEREAAEASNAIEVLEEEIAFA